MAELHRSARGKMIDMNRLATQNELTLAVSNVKINARGDEIGPGGQIIRKNNETEIISSGIPSEQHIPRVIAAPAAVIKKEKPVVLEEPKLAVPTLPTVDTESQNALVQPAKSHNNNNYKGK
jgi:hypothetical protein